MTDINFDDIIDDVYNAIDTALEKGALAVESDAVQNVAADRGGLRTSIDHKSEGLEWTVYSPLDYAGVIEYGGQPRWVPIEPLKVWARRNLGDEKIAYAIQKTIAQKGTAPKPFLRPAIEKNEKNIGKWVVDEIKKLER